MFMKPRRDDMQSEFDAVQAGRLADLSLEQVARLEARLNADADAAERLADVYPEAEPALLAPVEMPTADTWNRVWTQIEVAAAQRRRSTPARTGTFLRWRPILAAAAVCALMIGTWTFRAPPSSNDWPIEWAHTVQISYLEVATGATPLVIAAGAEDAIPIIWVLDAGS
jgi:hypothetical protein